MIIKRCLLDETCSSDRFAHPVADKEPQEIDIMWFDAVKGRTANNEFRSIKVSMQETSMARLHKWQR